MSFPWREKSKALRYEIRKIRILRSAAKPDWRKKSAGFRDFVRRHKAYKEAKFSAERNWKAKSMQTRQMIKADREKLKIKKLSQGPGAKPGRFN